VYVGHDEIPSVKSGLGAAILSTSQGVMDDVAAREKKIGGEVLCTIW
jgi:small subunit ribosomal protein S8